ncbi:MAG: hypothetical protein ER33_07245 [Cyanobium sp. CACIAM 14]|nr:MAG: hypothetical protein ER33_07245 [Cyanobium sp. CACIAM 14]
MNQIDLPLAAELVLALLLVATLDHPLRPAALPEQPLEDPAPAGWTPETDRHAQRILRLERRRGVPQHPLS